MSKPSIRRHDNSKWDPKALVVCIIDSRCTKQIRRDNIANHIKTIHSEYVDDKVKSGGKFKAQEGVDYRMVEGIS
jgi:hypothetical protein